jgi:predicted amidohydrolase
VPETLALDGAQLLINVSSSPGRDLAAIHEVGLGTAVSWRTLMRTYAQLTTSFVVFCNRVGMDETISFWGGSEVIAPSGEALFTAPLFDEGLYTVDVELGDVRRERVGLPLLRDERPELHLRELRRILAERTGLDLDEASEPLDGPPAALRADGPTGGPKGGPTREQRTRR